MLYYLDATRRSILNALSAGDIRVVILFGPPGVGKTSLGRYFATTRNAEVVYYLCHPGTSLVELSQNVDAGMNSEEKAHQSGALLRAVEITRAGEECVLIIDELDKAPKQIDAFLLAFLQTGHVYAKGRLHQADMNKLYVFITSDETRLLSQPLLCRCLCVQLNRLINYV